MSKVNNPYVKFAKEYIVTQLIVYGTVFIVKAIHKKAADKKYGREVKKYVDEKVKDYKSKYKN